MEQNLSTLIQDLTERQETAEKQLSDLREVVKALEARIAEIGRTPARQTATAADAETTNQTAIEKPKKAEITPEILVMLAAAATAYLGKKVRVRSAKMLQSPYEIINPWSQQGRVFVQASHNQHLRHR